MAKNDQRDQDRRRYPRVESLYLLSYVSKEEGVQRTGVSMARTLDISPEGARVEVYEPVAPDSDMEIEIAIEELVLSLMGRVVHSKEIPGGKYVLGIHFNEMQERLGQPPGSSPQKP